LIRRRTDEVTSACNTLAATLAAPAAFALIPLCRLYQQVAAALHWDDAAARYFMFDMAISLMATGSPVIDLIISHYPRL
jgi:hypothetical protein